jgi:peptidoglycan-N-acetylglucosamine deacetylase
MTIAGSRRPAAPRRTGFAMLALIGVALFASTGPVSATAAATVIWHGPRTEKVVALTFDDGWSATNCQRIYDILIAKHVTATWFPNSMYMQHATALWKKIGSRFPIANHTHSHAWLTHLGYWQIRWQLRHDEEVAEQIIGHHILKLFRPPYGAYNTTVLQAAYSVGYQKAIIWDASAGDTASGATVASLVTNATRGTNGSIVLMHCGPSLTPLALPAIIDSYRARGFAFTTVPKLLAGS